MLKLSRLWGTIATGLVLLSTSIAIAEQSASPKANPTPSAARPAERSGITSSLICDSSGKKCIAAAGSRRSGAAEPGSPAPSAVVHNSSSFTPVAAPSRSRIAGPESNASTNQAGTAVPLICDVSGKICALVKPSAGSATAQAATAKTDAKSNQTKLQADDEATYNRIDGAGESDENVILPDEDPFNWVVHAYKSRHRLEVYFKGHLYRTYHAVFGRSPVAGAKLWEGDRRTPEGYYLIVSKHRSARFEWFLRINYPNEQDHERFEQSVAAHLIPASAHEGGQIGIHGTDSPYLNVSEVDWTTGCISVDNADISELAQLLPIGSLVVINP
jgi:lipoprotein-anchoring transpeptidase ErfK/SrfK